MNPTVDTMERLAYEGMLAPTWALAVGGALAVVVAGLLTLERSTLGWLPLTTFATLRITAMAIVLWMLVGPAHETRHRSVTRHSIGIFVDNSASMDTFDPQDLRQDTRWRSAGLSKEEMDQIPLVCCDRAAIAIGGARRAAMRADDMIRQRRAGVTIQRKCAEIRELLGRAREYLETATLCPTANPQDTESIERARHDIAEIVERILPANDPPFTSIDGDSAGTPRGLHEVLRELARCERRLDRLCRDLTLTVPDGNEQRPRSRIDRVAEILERLEQGTLASLSKSIDIARYTFTDSVKPVSLSRTSNSWSKLTSMRRSSPADQSSATDILATLDFLRQSSFRNCSAAVLFTDGRHTAVGLNAPAEVMAAGLPMPVHVVPIGSSQMARDLTVQSLNAPRTVIQGDQIELLADIGAYACAGERAKLTLKCDGQIIIERMLSLGDARAEYREPFEVKAERLGRYDFEVLLESLPGETTVSNNRATASVQVVRDKLRVLLADGGPRWEYRFLEQLFRRDQHVELDQVLFSPRVIATGARQASSGLPRDVEEWNQYDIVILGDIPQTHFPHDSVHEFVQYIERRGGNAVIIAGDHHMPQAYRDAELAEILPVVAGSHSIDRHAGYTIACTSEGSRVSAVALGANADESGALWRDIYEKRPIYMLSEFYRPKPAAHVLLHAVGRNGADDADENRVSFLSWHPVGGGRIAFIGSPATYHLRFRQGDTLHHRFWGQLIRWLTATERSSGSWRVRVDADRVRVPPHHSLRVTVRLQDSDRRPVSGAQVNVVAKRDGAPCAELSLQPDAEMPGRYVGEWTPLDPGNYELVPQGPEVERLMASAQSTDPASPPAVANVQVVRAEAMEMTNATCDRHLLQQIADATGGLVIPPDALHEVLEMSARPDQITERVERRPLWNTWSTWWGVFVCVVLEWLWRKRIGLI